MIFCETKIYIITDHIFIEVMNKKSLCYIIVKALISSSSVYSAKGRSFTVIAGTKLQFCRRQVFHRELRNQGCSFTRAGPSSQAQEPSCSSTEGRSSTANLGTKTAVLPGQVLHRKRRNQAAVLPKAGLPLQTQEPWLQFY